MIGWGTSTCSGTLVQCVQCSWYYPMGTAHLCNSWSLSHPHDWVYVSNPLDMTQRWSICRTCTTAVRLP